MNEKGRNATTCCDVIKVWDASGRSPGTLNWCAFCGPTMPLDVRGDIAAAEIAFYVPFTVVSLVLTVKHGMTRDAGFAFLFMFGLSKYLLLSRASCNEGADRFHI
jgi:hypothetical protein